MCLFEILDYKTNATWADVKVIAGENNFPVLTEDFYGRGCLYILNVPENFSDLYKLPRRSLADDQQGVCQRHGRLRRRDHPGATCSPTTTTSMGSIRTAPPAASVNVIVKGDCTGIRDLESGAFYPDRRHHAPPSPPRRQRDADRGAGGAHRPCDDLRRQTTLFHAREGVIAPCAQKTPAQRASFGLSTQYTPGDVRGVGSPRLFAVGAGGICCPSA